MLLETAADLPRAHPDDGVLGEVHLRRAAEELNGEVPFLQIAPLRGERLFDDVTQKALGTLTSAKGGALQNPAQFGSNRLLRNWGFVPTVRSRGRYLPECRLHVNTTFMLHIY